MDEPTPEQRARHASTSSRPDSPSGGQVRAGARVVRLDVDRPETLRNLVTTPLPYGLRDGPAERVTLRDIYYDTPERDLERRGAVCRVRLDPVDGRTLRVKLRALEGDEAGGTRTVASAPVQNDDDHEAFRAETDAGRLLRSLVDPAALTPVMEIDTDRWRRSARWLWFRRPCLEFTYDVLTSRMGDRAVSFGRIRLRPRSGPGPSLARVGRTLVDAVGVRPSLAGNYRRARELIRSTEAEQLAQGLTARGRCVVLPFQSGQLGLLRRPDGLVAIEGTGTGEESCREALDRALGTTQAQLRLLGTAPAAGSRPSLEVWLARRIPGLEGAPAGRDLAWTPLERLPELVGTPLLRHGHTLAALQVSARSDLMREEPTW
ncbi:MAG: CYTH domain-containing protein, partial [Longimicrobiales bacterium]|nr:CYTH domain-containing protein [Longimicrobiales bacterium]